jgi:hypothetical protein
MLPGKEKLFGSHHDAQSPWPQSQSSQNQALDQTADKVQR